MKIQTGMLLQSHSISPDDYFINAMVCIVEYNANGALGFVVNRPFSRGLNELVAFAHLPPFPLYEGGPVDGEHLYFIHRRPDIIEGGETVSRGLYFGGDFKQVTEAIRQGDINERDIRIFVGYCGWDAGDLERETAADEWAVADSDLFL